MGRILPAVIKDPFEQLPTGVLALRVESMQEVMLGKEGEEVYGIEATFTVAEPKEAEGLEHREGFFIGIRENDKAVVAGRATPDPNCESDATFAARAGRFKKLCAAAGVSIGNGEEGVDLDQVFAVCVGKVVLAKVEHKPSTNNPELMNARVARWMAPGTAEVGVTNEAPKSNGAAGAPKAGPSPMSRPTPPTMGAPRAATPPTRVAPRLGR
ncbi:hypothetical protein [Nitrospira sp. BLG_1]|uniref:hypothetical protein n=1 Tax=Nitrospira sp. BLG_1 TaxID=3395883 RepID=UPI0039BC641D